MDEDEMVSITIGWQTPDGTIEEYEYIVPQSLYDYIQDLHRQITELDAEATDYAFKLEDYENRFDALRPTN